MRNGYFAVAYCPGAVYDQMPLKETSLVVVPCNCYALRRASRRATQLYDQLLAPCGLRATQFSVLIEIQNRAPVPLGVLAKHMMMEAATIGKNLRPLEADGYVVITAGADRRSR